MGKDSSHGRSQSLIEQEHSIQNLRSYINVKLQQSGIADSDIETDIIIMEALNLNRVELASSTKLIIPQSQLNTIESILNRRVQREPLSYILGNQPFYGLDFTINAQTLIPRPETELLVEEILNFTENIQSLSVADIGTGSGVIAVSLAIMRPDYGFYAVDISETAIAVAHQNANKHKVSHQITFKVGDLFASTTEQFDIIASNLPYIPTDRISKLEKELSWEPIQALDGGLDGTQVISKLLEKSKLHVKHNSTIFLEIDNSHANTLVNLTKRIYPLSKITLKQDLQGFDRILIIEPFGATPT